MNYFARSRNLIRKLHIKNVGIIGPMGWLSSGLGPMGWPPMADSWLAVYFFLGVLLQLMRPMMHLGCITKHRNKSCLCCQILQANKRRGRGHQPVRNGVLLICEDDDEEEVTYGDASMSLVI